MVIPKFDGAMGQSLMNRGCSPNFGGQNEIGKSTELVYPINSSNESA